MKRWIHLGLAAASLLALVACNGKKVADRIDWQEGEMLAVGFLGYYDSFGAFEASPSYLQLTKSYPQIVEAVKVDSGIGRQVYLVVPRDPMSTLAVNECGRFVEDAQVFYRSEEGHPVLIFNNFFESNTEIVCTDNEGRTVTYVPETDGRTGALQKDAGGAVHDISRPIPEPMQGYTFFDYGEAFEGNNLGIQVRLQAGRPVLTMSAAPLEAIGYDPDSFVLADGDNEFSGINGLCKGVFLGTIGQDYNPVVCVVMENGDVKKCTAFYAMQHGEPELSPALPGLKDVTGFERGNGEPLPDGEGDILSEYETIFALDARGGRTEVEAFPGSGHFIGKDGETLLEADLSPDWRFSLSCFRSDGDLAEVYNGSFSEKSRSDGPTVFNYRIERRGRIAEDNISVDETPRTGTFTVREEGLSYEVSLSGADVFLPGTLFRDDRLINAEENEDFVQ